MMQYLVIYNNGTGEIERIKGSSQIAMQEYTLDEHQASMLLSEPIDGRVSYIDLSGEEPEIKIKGIMPLVHAELSLNVNEQITITGIPTDTLVIYPGGEYTENDGELTIGFATPGKHVLLLMHVKYEIAELIIEVD